MKRALLFFLFVFISFFAIAHPVHVSVCNLEIENKRLILAVKIFSDDFQLALQHNYGALIELEKLTAPENKAVIDKYINAALQIYLNKKEPLRLSYSNTEMNEEAIWLFYSIDTDKIKKLVIQNKLLLDIYLDQTNLVIINYDGKQNGYRFNAKHFEKTIDLK